MSLNILLVEDDESLNRGISFKLKKEGYQVCPAFSLGQAREIFNAGGIDLIILDAGLPDGSGFDFCSEIRTHSSVYILFLTACDRETDIVAGYDTGGDDYITKPFSLAVLMSKIGAFARRIADRDNSPVSGQPALLSGNIALYPSEMKLLKSGQQIDITRNEFKLLRLFLENAQQVLMREQILSVLWDIDGNFVDDNTIAVNIRRLREKIEDDPSNPVYIGNVRGMGYKWQEGCSRI
ncbi:MAG TPA: response regulator transcription factor [Clostridia bacterium]|nr:response regulator transcription factor [Clostridia bacterium]